MARLIAWRLLQLPVLLMVIYTVTFVLAWVAPGDPLVTEGRKPDPAIAEVMRAKYRLDSSWAFYWDYLAHASGWSWLRGETDRVFDFCPSLAYKDQTVNGIIGEALPVSVQLGTAAIIMALFIGVGAGVAGSLWKGGMADMMTLGVALVGISLPTFVTGSVLVAIFVVALGWVPIGEWGDWRLMVLASVTLSLPFAAYIARLTRLGMLDVMSSDFIRTARAKGLGEGRVVMKHALKVAFLPVLSFLGPASAAAMTGSFVVEKVFNVPGMGQHFVDAVRNKDITLIMGVVLVYATMLIVFNLAVDVAYHLVDPRIELE